MSMTYVNSAGEQFHAVVLIDPETSEPSEGVDITLSPYFKRVSAAGSVIAGAVEVSIVNVGTTNGTLLGEPLKPDEGVTFRVSTPFTTLAAVPFNAVGTEFLISVIGVANTWVSLP